MLKDGRSFQTACTTESRKYGTVSFEVCAVCVYRNGKRGKHGIEHSDYAAHKIFLNLKAVRGGYSGISGIEKEQVTA